MATPTDEWLSGRLLPIVCPEGNITAVASAAFKPTMERNTRLYADRCPDAELVIDV